MTHKKILRIAAALLCTVMVMGACPCTRAASFSDVAANAWYADYVSTLCNMGLVSGYADNTFKPSKKLTRGEFLRLVDLSLGGSTAITGGNHWASGSLKRLKSLGVVVANEIPDTAAAMNTNIVRYEMAVILSRTLDCIGTEAVNLPACYCELTDIETMPEVYRGCVLDAYFNGLLTGYSDGTFAGERNVTRAEAMAVMCRLLFPEKRVLPTGTVWQQQILWQMGQTEVEFTTPDAGLTIIDGITAVSAPEPVTNDPQPVFSDPSPAETTPVAETPDTSDTPDTTQPVSDSFAPVTGAVGFMTKEQQRELLFGSSTKTRFESEEEARPFMTDVTVPIWTLKASGEKVATAVTITVNKALVNDVKGIFQLIFNGEEQYPIQSIGAFSWTSQIRSEHNWGSGIDINPYANPYIAPDGRIVVGDYYDPSNPLCLTADSDVVRAFAAYGWGWGGEGKWSSGYLDYMHLSLMGT